jgi:hypothetical protein
MFDAKRLPSKLDPIETEILFYQKKKLKKEKKDCSGKRAHT